MEILQHYYTSCINRETGSAGFQVKAMSPGISPDTLHMILRLIAYRIPPSQDERAFKTHPRALRYYPFNERESLLISSRSNGSDPNGRPGNFFAHTLVVDPQVFTTVPPILYWESDFWCTEDAKTRQNLDILPELPGDPALDITLMWEFLQQDNHLDIFFKLMCAVVHGTSSHHRIIIVDSDEHVALWIAAVSCMLPPAYRPLLSFTTYHHDPYQSQFFITGTPPAPELRLTPEDYTSYFIMNMHENKISAVDGSLYAELTRMYTNPEQYDNEMLTFFSRFAQRFPHPTAIDERLDSITLYARIMNEGGSVALTPGKLQAISHVLPTFEELTYYNQEDIKDLKHLGGFLRRVYQTSDNFEASQLRQRIVDLLNRHKVPTDEIFKQDLADRTHRLFGTYTSDTATIALQGLARLLQDYGKEKFIDQANQADYLSMLLELVSQAQAQHLTHMWGSIGPYLLPGTITGKIFAQSISIWGQTSEVLRKKLQDAKPANDLFDTLQKAISIRAQDWFRLLVTGSSQQQTLPIHHIHLGLFYCQFVFSLTLKEREPYRNILLPIFGDIVDTEFAYDLTKTKLQMILPAIRTWVVYAQHSQIRDPSALVAQGLMRLWNHYQAEPAQWSMIARQCLVDPQLTPSLGQWEPRLLKDAFAQLSLSQFEPEHLLLYRQYRYHAAMPPRSKTIINGLLAMHDLHLDQQLAQELYEYASSLSHEAYDLECTSFCNSFFTPQLNNDDHFSLLTAFFVWNYAETFWRIYWEKICVQPAESVARLLAFWFTLHPTQLAQSYITQGFLLTLQQNLQHCQKMPDFQKALSQLTRYPWYTAIQESNLNRKHALLVMGKDLMKQVQKRLPNQKSDDEAEEQRRKLQDEIHALFERGRIRDMHLSQLMRTYQTCPPTQFWEIYKERLIQLLLSNNAEHTLEFFSFWFDESFSSFAHQPFIAQSFFIGLPQIFELAGKENEGDLRKLSLKMNTRAEQAPASYNWYALLQSLLPEPQTSEQHPRRFKR
jgi:GTPase-associated protein 1, N-terminal domain type 2/GTPase-associated protein 1, middle domain